METAKCAGRKQFGEMVRFFEKNPNSRAVIVEKTDRLYRNFRDHVTLEDLGVELHLPKEGQILGKDAKSQDKLIHGIHWSSHGTTLRTCGKKSRKVCARKLPEGFYPGRAPFGYCHNTATHNIEPHPVNGPVVREISICTPLASILWLLSRKIIKTETGRLWPKSHLERMLKNPIYSGLFVWNDKTHQGKHEPLVSAHLFQQVQEVFRSFNRSKYRKHNFAFAGLLKCAHDSAIAR